MGEENDVMLVSDAVASIHVFVPYKVGVLLCRSGGYRFSLFYVPVYSIGRDLAMGGSFDETLEYSFALNGSLNDVR